MSNVWTLPGAFGLRERKELVALVGGGGKTSLMFALAAALPGRVVVTTTTRIFAAQMKLAPAVVYAADLSRLGDELAAHRVCLVVGEVDGDKARGVDPDLPDRLLARRDVDAVLVEADGSRMRPVKAPAGHEPVIPPETTLLIPVAGLDALERPLDEAAHRPERVRAVLHAADSREPLLANDHLTPAGLAALLGSAEGGLKGAPDGARVVPLLNKVETTAALLRAREAARRLLGGPRVEQVVLGAVRTDQPVREVRRRVTAAVLAAGLSSRMGRNKLALPWGETTVLGGAIANLRASGVANVVVVTGYEAGSARRIASAAGAAVLENPDYERGMVTSLQAVVRALPPSTSAVLAVLGDQPMVPPAVYDALLNAYAGSPRGLVAPFHNGRRGNPVLIDRRYFDELLALPPEEAPRRLLDRHPDDLLAVPVDTDAILQDLDTPEAYDHLRPR